MSARRRTSTPDAKKNEVLPDHQPEASSFSVLEESTTKLGNAEEISVKNRTDGKDDLCEASGSLVSNYRIIIVVALLAFACGISCWIFDFGSTIASHVGNTLFQVLGSELTLFVFPPIFSRFAMPIATETCHHRIAWSIVVGAAAYFNHHLRVTERCSDYSILLVIHAASYLFTMPLRELGGLRNPMRCGLLASVAYASRYGLGHVEMLCISTVSIMLLGSLLVTELSFFKGFSDTIRIVIYFFYASVGLLVHWILPLVLCYCLPIEELTKAYELVADFVGAFALRRQCMDLLIITMNTQIPLGYLGIAFLRKQQARSNYMLQIGDGKVSARQYTKYVLSYITMVAVPYMLQRTIMESVNTYAFGCFSRELDNVLRIDTVLPTDTHSGVLLAAVAESNHTLSSFADSFHTAVSQPYDIIERKLFSLPKIALLPGMLMSKPWLVVSVLPASILLDACKSVLVAILSSRIEDYAQEIQKVTDLRQRIEQHDTKHEELIRRGGVGSFTKDRWYEISHELYDLELRSGALTSVRSFVQWLYWQDFMTPGFECALGFLLEIGHITNVDIYLYIRVVEDSIDMLLTRSRLQAQLASLETHMQRLAKLKTGLADIRTRTAAQCLVKGTHVSLTNLNFSRGGALRVQIPQLSFPPGVYAVTGANGCGKSSFFGILASCSGTTLPAGVVLATNSQIALPSVDIVEITQQVYCPIHIKPINWFLRTLDTTMLPTDAASRYEGEITKWLRELQFYSKTHSSDGMIDLHVEKEDWYGELSGGQRLKVELIAKVFLKEKCPAIVLLDEVFGPLDPDSKLFVQKKIKSFCSQSTVLVIYHSDVHSGCVGGDSDNFFDGNIRFENGTARLAKTCGRDQSQAV